MVALAKMKPIAYMNKRRKVADRINTISQIISEAKDLMDNYHTASESKFKFSSYLTYMQAW
jgi:hypothetical protein